MKKLCAAIAVIIAITTISYLINRKPLVTISKSQQYEQSAETFAKDIVGCFNNEKVKITVGGDDMSGFSYHFFVSESMKLMVESDFLKSVLSCSVMNYNNGRVVIMKGRHEIELHIGDSQALVNDEKIDLGAVVFLSEDDDEDKQETLFIPLDNIADVLCFEVNYYPEEKWIDIALTKEEDFLPEAYDMRDYGRVTKVRDQGKYGTCWAFASLGALETTLMPKEMNMFSTDHMSMCNSYNLDPSKGGEHSMSIAYLAAWQGPVYERDDPYGDGETNPKLKAVKHLEEALIIEDRDMEALKSAIFRYGALETSLYSQLAYSDSSSNYYSEDYNTYYYDGEEAPNHDVVVVGWDDNFPKEKFTIKPETDGAFICKNSWGDEFGENGYFYVSYCDVNICNKAVVYTRVGEADNYDNIYQSDLLGWVGQMGFGREEAYIANVYTAGKQEALAAVSFYATGKDTEFEVYYVRNFEKEISLKNRTFVTSGIVKYSGYYTVEFPEEVLLDDNETFAVIVKVKTPGQIHPVAIEYSSDERTENFDITDGRGYISLYGEVWHSAENKENCNVCLKAFTRDVVNKEPE